MSLFLILLAAGDSKRLKSSIPKPYLKLNNKSILENVISTFQDFKEIKKIVVVYNKNHKKFIDDLKLKKIIKIVGGKSRQESAFRGLKKIKKLNCKKVIIHDVARPLVPSILIKNLLIQLKKNHAVIPVIKTNDATKRIDKRMIFKNIQRNSLRFSQTPQGFTYKEIYEKHKKNITSLFDDDSALFTKDKNKVKTIKGSKLNLKITDSEDFKIIKSLQNKKVYYGIGFDVHRLIKNKKLYLGGIKIPYPLGFMGHSDGDPVLHSLIDALLGACRLGDIGQLFSDKNKKFKNIRSTILLEKVIKLIKSKNFKINNIDINIIAQKPKIKKYSKKMIILISNICETDSKKINIKGKTTEKLGLIGKGKAISSQSIVSVINNNEKI